jgi:CBS domain-containing protein
MNAAEIMSHPVIGIAPDEPIAEAARKMLQNRISGLPVTKGDTLVGIVTEGDLLRRAETGTEKRRPRWLELLVGPGPLAGDYVATHGRKVGEVMTGDIVAVAPDAPLESVVRLMEKRHIKRVPVVDDNRLVGIVSRADLVRALLHTLVDEAGAASKPGASDTAIRGHIMGVIDREAWGPRFSVDVTVANGVVDLHGTITDERERTAVRVAAENTVGVKAVHDHLVWVEPNTGLVIPGEDDR